VIAYTALKGGFAMDDRERVVISQVMTRKELAEYLHCRIATIDKLVRKGQIPVFRVAEHVRFRLDNIKDRMRETEK
jgi:excisionase family DNA binding protein